MKNFSKRYTWLSETLLHKRNVGVQAQDEGAYSTILFYQSFEYKILIMVKKLHLKLMSLICKYIPSIILISFNKNNIFYRNYHKSDILINTKCQCKAKKTCNTKKT